MILLVGLPFLAQSTGGLLVEVSSWCLAVTGCYLLGLTRIVRQQSVAVNTSTQTPWVLRVTDGKTERVNVTLGLRDSRTERVLVASGLAENDTLLRGAAQGITPGTSVQLSGR